MARPLGAIVVLAIIAAPLFAAPAFLWHPSAPPEATDAEPQAAPALHDVMDSGVMADSEFRVRSFGYASDALVLSDERLESTQNLSSVALLRVATFSGEREMVLLQSKLETAPESESSGAGGSTPSYIEPEEPQTPQAFDVQAFAFFEAQRTIVAVGLTLHAGLFSPSVVTPSTASSLNGGHGVPAPVDGTALPGWLLQATWVLLLLSIGLAARPAAGTALLALFSRFTQSDLLSNERRSRLFAAIQADPGASFGELCQRAGLAAGVAQHHLRLLEQHEVVRRVRDGRTTRFYPRGPKFAPPALKSATRQRLMELVRSDPTLPAASLAARLGQRTQSTWHHVRVLEAAGVLTPTKQGRTVRWHATA
jgi:predicted transcriptional regulator